MFETFNKRGNRSKIKATRDDEDHTGPNRMYQAATFGGGRPDVSRRLTNNYGKTAGKRAEYKPEVGAGASFAGRMFNMAKDGINRYRGF